MVVESSGGINGRLHHLAPTAPDLSAGLDGPSAPAAVRQTSPGLTRRRLADHLRTVALELATWRGHAMDPIPFDEVSEATQEATYQCLRCGSFLVLTLSADEVPASGAALTTVCGAKRRPTPTYRTPRQGPDFVGEPPEPIRTNFNADASTEGRVRGW